RGATKLLLTGALVWSCAKRFVIHWQMMLLLPYTAFAGALVLVLLVAKRDPNQIAFDRRKTVTLTSGMVLLAVLPILAVIGTNDLLFLRVACYWAPWYLLLFLLLWQLWRSTRNWMVPVCT